jgi:hypothetical protein
METSREGDHGEIRSRRDFGRGAQIINVAAAKASLEQDLAPDGGGEADYKLDGPTRDRLIAHARQDAAHALWNGFAAYKNAREAAYIGIAALLVGLLNAALLVWVLVKLT